MKRERKGGRAGRAVCAGRGGGCAEDVIPCRFYSCLLRFPNMKSLMLSSDKLSTLVL